MLTRQEIEDVASRMPLMGPPKDILILEDSLIATPDGGLALAATQPFGPSTLVFTVESDQESYVHEMVHRAGVLNESLTRFIGRKLTPLVMRRRQVRQVKYQECTVGCRECISLKKAYNMAGIKSVSGAGTPMIKHLVLIE